MNDKELIAEARERAGYMALLAELTKNEPGAVTAREEADRMTRFADALEAAQNNNSRLERELLDHASHIGTLGEQVKNLVKALDAVEDEKRSLADRLAALTTPQDGGDALEARQPSEDDREALRKEFEFRIRTAIAHGCALGYRELSAQDRDEWVRGQVDRAVGSRAAVPDAATESDYHEGLEEGIKIGRAERDAALAAVERVRAIHERDMVLRDYCSECSDFGSDQFPPGQMVEWPCPTVAALDGAPEPEGKP